MITEEEHRSFKAVGSKAARLRLQATLSQLTSALKLCSTAENALVLGQVQLAHNALEKAGHTAQWVRAHLKGPNHVAADSVASVCDQLAALEKRICKVEAGLQS